MDVRRLCMAWALASLVACTSARPVAPVDKGGLTELRLKAGDQIRVVTRQRQRISFEITELRSTEILGVTGNPARHEALPPGTTVSVPYDDLALVVVDRFSAARTAAPFVVLGVAAGLVLTVTPPVGMAGP